MSELNVKDLNLATYLSLMGYAEDRMELSNDGDAVWVYTAGEDIEHHLLNYATNNATVNPQDYSKEFGHMRRRMFEFLDGQAAG